eukprot:s505_g20.t1
MGLKALVPVPRILGGKAPVRALVLLHEDGKTRPGPNIEDPFEPSNNLGSGMHWLSMDRLQEEFERAVKLSEASICWSLGPHLRTRSDLKSILLEDMAHHTTSSWGNTKSAVFQTRHMEPLPEPQQGPPSAQCPGAASALGDWLPTRAWYADRLLSLRNVSYPFQKIR